MRGQKQAREDARAPSVSNVAMALIRVHMTGVKPIAFAIARTRSLIPTPSQRSPLRNATEHDTHSISPYGGRIMFGVTPSTSLMIFFVQPNSAMISSVDRVDSDGWLQVCTAIW